ncbi:MAG: HU family DNA-binding protein [Deltaproteobacteria bacterium]|jgi:nucleoid DNA-binding protein|nr:HU family DNA-binding protein [Deltaproteobacteria bacterium]
MKIYIDEEYPYSGLGVFQEVTLTKRKNRNPSQDEAIEAIEAKAYKVVKFKPAKTLKDTSK